MLAVALMLGIVVSPFVLWIVGVETAYVVLVSVYVALTAPSIVSVSRRAFKSRAWPKIIGGPGFTWFGKQKSS